MTFLRSSLAAAGLSLFVIGEAVGDALLVPPEIVLAASCEDPEQSAVSDSKIAQFAKAYAAVATIQIELAEKLKRATTAAEVSQLHTLAERESRDAVLAAGLALEEFDSLARRAACDLALRHRIDSKLAERIAV